MATNLILEVEGRQQRLEATADRVTVGSHPDNDLVIADDSVSRFHCVLERIPQGLLLRDLESRNGTHVRDVRVREVIIDRGRERIVLGRCVVLLEIVDGEAARTPCEEAGFGSVLGRSPAMTRMFRVLERVSASDVTVLLGGETGTGKSMIARAIHDHSPRASKPFVVVDCASLPPTLIESELFGHERGSFTGAQEQRPGAFEVAAGGTLFLDEIGELPTELQPKLLRAIEAREIKRIGANVPVVIDVRLIAATNRALLREVESGGFRRDLYYRLNVVQVRVPALRQRPEDIRVLALRFIDRFRHLPPPFEITEDDWRAMESAAWPGNVRELKAAIERAYVLGERSYLHGHRTETPANLERFELPVGNDARCFREAKRSVVAAFERAFVTRIMRETDRNLSEAARRAGMDRNYLRVLVNRHLPD